MERTVETILQIPLLAIRPATHQARKHFNQEAIQLLAESMDHEGLIQPITVRLIKTVDSLTGLPVDRDTQSTSQLTNQSTVVYELISGERRLRAAKFLGWESIPARVIRVISEGEAVAKGMVENLQREDLNPIEEAEGFAKLNEIDREYWTQERIAQVAGKERTYVTRSIGLLNLPDPVKESVRQGQLSRGHAIELMRLSSAELQLQTAKRMEKMTVHQARHLVDRLTDFKGKTAKRPSLLEKSSQTAQAIAQQEGIGPSDPLAKEWSVLAEEVPAVQHMDWKADYQGNWTWQINLNLSNYWAMTSSPVSTPSPDMEKERLRELRKAISTWFERVSQELKSETI